MLIQNWFNKCNSLGNKKNSYSAIAADEFMFVLMILGKIKETRWKFSQEIVTVL